MEIIRKTKGDIPLFVTERQKKKFDRNMKIYKDYKRYMSVEGQIQANVIDFICVENDMPFSTVYSIIRRMDKQFANNEA